MSSRDFVSGLVLLILFVTGSSVVRAEESSDVRWMPSFVRMQAAPEMLLVDASRDILRSQITYEEQEDVSGNSFEPPPDGTDLLWSVIKGNKVFLYYLPGASLAKIEARLGTRQLPLSPHYRRLFTSRDYPIETRINARLQFLMMRVEDILGMKPFIPKLKIELYRTRKDMQEAYASQVGLYIDARSFYVHKNVLIYSSEQDLIDSIIAHEMAHAVIDHFFKAPPPVQVAELLAAHVDEHLEGR